MRVKALLALLLSLCAVSAYAQFKASIQGTVIDPQGNAVPGAKVTVTNQATNLSRDTVASGEGFYRVSELPHGTYNGTVEAPGFKQATSKGIVVEAEQPRGLDITLEVGAVNEQVTVTASAEALHTENANVGNTVSTDEITRLPEVGRDPYELLRLTPGVFGDGARQGNGNTSVLPNNSGPGGSNSSIFQVENQVQVSANGQRTASNNFTIDGVSVNSLGFGGAAVITPNQESVQEITVLSSSYSAEDGRGTGAQVKVVSKSGTNQFYGSGFFNYQHPNWNAFNRFHGAQAEKPSSVHTKCRQFAGRLGGPVWKDKLFFFFSYEGLRSNNLDTSAATLVETPQFRQLVINARPGSATAKILASTGITPRIANVLTSTCAGAGITDPTHCQAVTRRLHVRAATRGY